MQTGDDDPTPFSWRTRAVRNRCVCWVTRTTARRPGDHPRQSRPLAAVCGRDRGRRSTILSLDRRQGRAVSSSPDPHGVSGARGAGGESIYVNGLSTSLPADVQERVVTIRSRVSSGRYFLRYGYAVEYDVVAPRQVAANLECRSPGAFSRGPAARHLGLRGGGGARFDGRHQCRSRACAARRRSCRGARTPISGFWWMTSAGATIASRTACSLRGRNTDCSSAWTRRASG